MRDPRRSEEVNFLCVYVLHTRRLEEECTYFSRPLCFLYKCTKVTRYGEIMYDNSPIQLNISLAKFLEGFKLNFVLGLCTSMCGVKLISVQVGNM